VKIDPESASDQQKIVEMVSCEMVSNPEIDEPWLGCCPLIAYRYDQLAGRRMNA
jgi:hypothetical protein